MPSPSPSSSQRLSRLRALGGAAPRLRIGFALPLMPPSGVRRVLPLRRWKAAIVVLAVVFTVMCLPLVAGGLPSLDTGGSLSNFSTNLFQWFWLLGWSVGALLPGLALALLILGREVVIARPGLLTLRVEILGFGLAGDYPAAGVRDLRYVQAGAAPGSLWRGSHLAFSYYDVPIEFGSDIAMTDAGELRLALTQVLASAVIEPSPPMAPTPSPTPPAAIAPLPPAAPAVASALSVAGLIAANLIPLAGVLIFAWEIGEIMLLYWAESVIIGLINVVKLIVVGRWAAVFYAPFFLAHYGAFMAAHMLFVWMFFLRGMAAGGDVQVAELVHALFALWPALLGLTVSHLLSFVQNFIGRGEFTRIKLAQQMNAPYRRVIVMQLTIIIGGMLMMLFGSSLPALGLLIALKIVTDVHAHRNERRRAQDPADAAS